MHLKLSSKKIVVLSLVIFAFLVSGSVVLLYRSGWNKTESGLKIIPGNIDLEIKEFVYTEIGEHKTKWEVKAHSATYDKKRNLAWMDKVKIKLTMADGKVFEMSADKGQMDTKKKDVQISGSVVILSNSGDKFMTDDICYSDQEKKFFTDSPIIMENNGMRITGRGMVLYMNKGQLKIPSEVRATIK
jgi:LPS export ABC transporter protein LptC